METQKQSKTLKRIKLMLFFLQKMKQFRKLVNKHMEGKYSPSLIALVVTLFSTLITMIILFVPNYLGVADDGSVTKVMNAVGVYYMQDDTDDIYNNYFVKTYSNVLESGHQTDNTFSSHILIIKAAVALDNLVTKDKLFDIRFLALIYTALYIPALYLILKQACSRVKLFSEGAVIGIIGGVIFSDVAYVTYFNSFYPEAIWFISMLYCIGFAMSFQEKRSGFADLRYLICFVLSGVVLISSKQQCAAIGIILAAFCIKLLFARQHWLWKVASVMSAFFLCLISLVCMMKLNSDFDTTSKYHAMTRGVLFGSDNPKETLEEFGIPSSYELLTDASSYDYLPLVNANATSLKEGFLDKYTISDISIYYIKHPIKFIRMLDVSIKSCFNVRRSYAGNYEKSVGMKPKAKSIFWSTWSTFKDTSAPKTIGYLIIVMVGIVMLFRKKYTLKPNEDRRSTVFLDALVITLMILLSQAAVTIVNSGDAEMIQHCFVVSLGVDILTYFAFSEVVHKLNII